MNSRLFLALFATGVAAQEGNLIVHKVVCFLNSVSWMGVNGWDLSLQKVLSEVPDVYASGENFTVTIDVYNIGDGSAFDVTVTDTWTETTSSGTDAFKLVDGDFATAWAEIPAGESVSTNFTIVPHFEGRFDGSRATGRYSTTKDAEAKVCFAALFFLFDLFFSFRVLTSMWILARTYLRMLSGCHFHRHAPDDCDEQRAIHQILRQALPGYSTLDTYSATYK